MSSFLQREILEVYKNEAISFFRLIQIVKMISYNFFRTITLQKSQTLLDPAKIKEQSGTGTLVRTCLLELE